MLKAKKYDWKDSNLALFGSDVEKKVKKESAESEPAWKGAGKSVGVQIWRINKFKVEEWPKEDYGKFFSGDSYIILNTYQEEGGDELLYDVHFWIGKYSTQDEYGTAAYKTVELDTLLDDKPVQHREVQGREGRMFKSYFKELILMKGGAKSGFRHVAPEEYKPRLLQCVGEKKNIEVKEVSLKTGSLNSQDVFILDLGHQAYQLIGSKSNLNEKTKASQFIQSLKGERSGRLKVEVLDENDTPSNHVFYSYLKKGDKKKKEDKAPGEKKLLRVSDRTGQLSYEVIATGGRVNKSLLKDDDVFMYDNGTECYVWVGSGASIDERKNGFAYAVKYLNGTDDPYKPITILGQGKEVPGLQ